MPDPTVTVYGELNPEAPGQLQLFSFLVGRWESKDKAKFDDGTYAEEKLAWVGRYVLNGMAITDEIHAVDEHGNPYLGISLRYFDSVRSSWTIEYLNVSGNFLRRQVAPGLGSVSQDGNRIIVLSSGEDNIVRETYTLVDDEHFTYNLDMSKDSGRSWDEGIFKLEMERKE